MEKNECKKLTEMFDEIEFIERLEQFTNNADNGVRLLVTPQGSNYKPIVFPEKIASFVLGTLVGYKDSLKDILANLQVVDKSIIPDESN
jgi:hypothetical protein|nr:MAG TPA: hypothetical protein [Caudoviricetes sp.]